MSDWSEVTLLQIPPLKNFKSKWQRTVMIMGALKHITFIGNGLFVLGFPMSDQKLLARGLRNSVSESKGIEFSPLQDYIRVRTQKFSSCFFPFFLTHSHISLLFSAQNVLPQPCHWTAGSRNLNRSHLFVLDNFKRDANAHETRCPQFCEFAGRNS